jgi:hypothetical protein
MLRKIEAAERAGAPSARRGMFLGALALSLACGFSSGVSAQGAAASTSKLKKHGSDSAVTTASVKSRSSGLSSTSAAKPALVGTFGDWGVYVSQGAKSKICYALAQPKDRQPSSLKRDQTYIFISNRPGEGVRNEVSIIMGLPLKDGAPGAKAEIGSTSYDLVAKGQNAFVKNAAEEGQFVNTLKRRGSRLVIEVSPAKGPMAKDTYSLAGVSQALDRVAKECP